MTDIVYNDQELLYVSPSLHTYIIKNKKTSTQIDMHLK